jgi:mono/diheme cytochrome c family protein
LAVVVSVLTAACGGEHKTPATDTGTSQPAAGATAAATALAAPVPGTPPTGATAQMATLGDSIFHGQAAGGLCFTCHGADARGTTLAPPLLDHKWLTGDGSYAFIQQRVTTGMPKQTPPYPGPMLPMGGAQLTPDQIKAVAAYVYSISHPAS